jgi:hypothetical protein
VLRPWRESVPHIRVWRECLPEYCTSFLPLFQADICSMDDALPFLVSLLQHKSVPIVENACGILRNISSYIATCEDSKKYR